MSGPLVAASSEGFQQSGQLDWVSLTKSTFSFGLDVLVRLSKAELDPLTIAVSTIIFNRFALNNISQQRIHDALSKLKSFSSYGKLIWFGFGVKSVVKDLAGSEQGMACVALCACMAVSYDSFYAAEVIRELCKLHDAPRGLIPSLQQWKTLVDICAGTLLHSEFPIRLEGMLRCVLPIAQTCLRKPTSQIALAKAIEALADVSTGKLESVTIAGGVDCIWLAAISEWLLSLDVEIRNSSGSTVYEGPRNDHNRNFTVTIIYISDNEHSPHISKCYIVPNGTMFWNTSSPEQHPFTGGRSEWGTILTDTFGPYFDALAAKDVYKQFAYFLFYNIQFAEACYQFGSESNTIYYHSARRTAFLRRIHFAHFAIRGQDLSSFASQALPELAAILNAVKIPGTESGSVTNLVDCIDDMTSRCECQRCGSRNLGPAPSDQPFCLWPYVLSVDPVANGIDILTAVMMLFSGLDNTGIMENGEYSALSQNGVCAYFKTFDDLDLLPEEALSVKVIPGYIDFEGTKYGKIRDLVHDATFSEINLGPRPTYELLVQEISQPGVIASAYRISSNFGHNTSLVGIAALANAVARSIRGPLQCAELCGRGSTYDHQQRIVFGPDSATSTSPFLRQWSLLSTRSSAKSDIELRIVQTVISRLYAELASRDDYHLRFLDICQACSSTVSNTRQIDKMSALPSPAKDAASQWSVEGTIRVSLPSDSGSWNDEIFRILFAPQVILRQGHSTIADGKTCTSSPIGTGIGYKRDRKPVLYRAAKLGYEGIVQLLLQGGAPVHDTTAKGATALHAAAEKDHSKIIRLLVERGASLGLKEGKGMTPLVKASQSGSVSAISTMIRYSVDLESRDSHGQSALVWAASRDHTTVVERLLKEKADVNA
ncbi:hypothetical protein EJ04DRAFT_397883, partial [Polyplosphaeria fusca]